MNQRIVVPLAILGSDSWLGPAHRHPARDRTASASKSVNSFAAAPSSTRSKTPRFSFRSRIASWPTSIFCIPSTTRVEVNYSMAPSFVWVPISPG